MRVIADTTPLRYLVVLRHVALLPTLFGQIFIPPAIAGNCTIRKRPPLSEPG